MGESAGSRWGVVAGAYRAAALLLCNTLVCLVALNLLAALILRLPVAPFSERNREIDPRPPMERLQLVYPGRSPAEIKKLLDETWSRPFAYEPFTQHREAVFSGRYVNVLPAGFRAVADQAPWPPTGESLTLFLFGGSTLFGYGLADDETVASYLQQDLRSRLGRRVDVYNFGRGHYYSVQERVLFEQLLLDGFVPDVALFLDGLNDFHYPGEPVYADRLSEIMEDAASERHRRRKAWAVVARVLPVVQLVDVFRRDGVASRDRSAPEDPTQWNEPAALEHTIERYFANKRLVEAVSKGFGVVPVFVWQPVPLYGYDLRHHLFTARFAEHNRSRFGYPMMAERVARGGPGPGFLWLADLQEGLTEPLYVDSAHYTAAMARRVASAIATGLVERHLLPDAAGS